MDWTLAPSLKVLRDQINTLWPNRNKASDGAIGDAAHQSVPSDHNPNTSGVVCALDITHDPANGLDAHALADRLLANRHPNLKYLISNNRIAGSWTGWKWTAYYGSNPHDKHIHVSVGVGEDGKSAPGTYENQTPWSVAKGEDMSGFNKQNAQTTVQRAYYFIVGVNPTDKERDAWADQLVKDANYMDDLLATWAELGTPFQYKARHYDEDVRNASVAGDPKLIMLGKAIKEYVKG